MYHLQLHQQIDTILKNCKTGIGESDHTFYARLIANAADIRQLYIRLYGHTQNQDDTFLHLLETVAKGYRERPAALRTKDETKKEYWFLDNDLMGMSLYVDRFYGNLDQLAEKLDYFKELGVNLLHLMPLFKSPQGESDGGYAVSDFRSVDEKFGTLDDLKTLQAKMNAAGMHLMIDIVLNHTSHRHEWAEQAKQGSKKYQDYYYMYPDRIVPDLYEQTMPEIFPEAAPGSFIWSEECGKWVMTVFHNYQWDLNYTNPAVLADMLDTIFFYANLGVDILRIDAPAFIWKQPGTTCQNLPEAHLLLRLIKLCVETATPGMALLGEAIVAPEQIMEYFGTGYYAAHECDLAYNATQMALQWDALATGDTSIMLAAQQILLRKPYGTSWITYTRCHDDIGLGYGDDLIRQAGYNAYEHRKFLKEYYSGNYEGSTSKGALFSVNPKTQDARISGTLASLCGLEKALLENNAADLTTAINKIVLMQAHQFFIGGIPMIFYGDEAGYTNDYSYLEDPAKSYDNRWMHRPRITWGKNKNVDTAGTPAQRIFSATKHLIAIRKKLPMVADRKNLVWLQTSNKHVAGYLRTGDSSSLFCLFNFSGEQSLISWFVFRQKGISGKLLDHRTGASFTIGEDQEHLEIEPYGFCLLETAG